MRWRDRSEFRALRAGGGWWWRGGFLVVKRGILTASFVVEGASVAGFRILGMVFLLVWRPDNGAFWGACLSSVGLFGSRSGRLARHSGLTVRTIAVDSIMTCRERV
jgi:hypothetical protein